MTTIRRQYSLPNCQLAIEGLVDPNPEVNQVSGRPLLSTLINAECRFTGTEQVLSGGRSFLESLVVSVSAYAQEFLSGVYHAQAHPEPDSAIAFAKTDLPDRHRLIWHPEGDRQGGGVATAAITFDLTTVQLFDLVEAIDQLLTDNRTLPDFTLTLEPISRRYRQADVPLAQRLAPAVMGVGSLAIAAGLFYLIPAPKEVEQPQARLEETLESATSPDNTASPPRQGDRQEDPAAETEPSPDAEDSNATPLSAEDLETLLASAPQISEPTELRYLERNLYQQLDRGWEDRSEVNRNLEYRVSVGQDGSIVRYEPIRNTTESSDRRTPLPDLIYTPTSARQPEQIADFRVVFTNRSVLQVSPWYGYKDEPTLGPEIETSSTLRRLNDQLYDTLREEWSGTPAFGRALEFRVAVTEDGTIADYEAQNQPASDFFADTPLPDLVQPEAAGIGDGSLVPKEPLAHFDVVFRPSGVLEVSPHRGY
jgi:hypothetical protein